MKTVNLTSMTVEILVKISYMKEPHYFTRMYHDILATLVKKKKKEIVDGVH